MGDFLWGISALIFNKKLTLLSFLLNFGSVYYGSRPYFLDLRICQILLRLQKLILCLLVVTLYYFHKHIYPPKVKWLILAKVIYKLVNIYKTNS